MTDILNGMQIRGYPIELPDQPTVQCGDPFSWRLQLGDPGLPLGGFGTGPWRCQFRPTPQSNTFIDATVQQGVDGDGSFVVIGIDADTTEQMRPYSQWGFDVQAPLLTVWRGQVITEADYTRG